MIPLGKQFQGGNLTDPGKRRTKKQLHSLLANISQEFRLHRRKTISPTVPGIFFSKKKRLLKVAITGGSLEVKLPTIWTDEKQRWEESERREEKESKERR